MFENNIFEQTILDVSMFGVVKVVVYSKGFVIA